MLCNYENPRSQANAVCFWNNGGAVPQKEYFTADEAMAFLEPRIRAMFR